MPVHYRLLAILLAAAAVFGAGTYLGYQYADGRHAKAAAEAQNAALERAREQAETDLRAAVERVRRDTLAAARARSARERGVSDASLKARDDCSRDAESSRLLIDAIGVANGAGSGSLPETVPKPGDSKGSVGSRD